MFEKLVFFHTGWMESYQGPDRICGGGAFVDEKDYGWEMWNFCDHNGLTYGFVEVGRKNPKKDFSEENARSMHIERIGGRLGCGLKDDITNHVTVVWTATHPQGEIYVVGWYMDAIVFRTCFSNTAMGYFPYIQILQQRIRSFAVQCAGKNSGHTLAVYCGTHN